MKAEYEVIGRKHGRIKVKIYIEGQREPIQHGIPVQKAKKHPESVEECINEHVRRIAERHADPGLSEEELPERGTVEFDSSANEAGPREEVDTSE